MSVGDLGQHLEEEKAEDAKQSNQEIWMDKREEVMDSLEANGLKCLIRLKDLDAKVVVTRAEETGEEDWTEGRTQTICA